MTQICTAQKAKMNLIDSTLQSTPMREAIVNASMTRVMNPMTMMT